MTKITIYPPHSQTPPSDQKNRFVSFDEFKSWVRDGSIFSHFFRYKESVLLAHDLRSVPKPFALALLTWLLARGRAERQDKKSSQKITIPLLLLLLVQLVRSYLAKPILLREIQKKISSTSSELKELKLSSPPIYLRTDFCFGLQSGGSVGHIAGVLNHLSQFTGNPIFLTTDAIPTIRPDWESHIIAPGNLFLDFSELSSLHFNQIFFNQAVQRIGKRRPSFIYQRYSLNNFSGIELARHYKVPFVLEFNGSEIWVNRNWGGHILKYEALSERIELLNLQLSDLVVVVSRPLKEELIAKGIDPNKILVNPNGVNPTIYSPEVDGTQIRQKYGLENQTVIGFIGTFGKWHGAEVLAEAYVQLAPALKDRVRLMMIGDGMTMPLVKQILGSTNTIFTGTVPQEAGPMHLAACDILVAPHIPNSDGSPFFGSPTKLFEYMAMGKGIVASNLDQIGEILEHNKSAWMVRPGDVLSLTEGLKTLILDKDLRVKLGVEARKKALSDHTWHEHTRKIVDRLKERFDAHLEMYTQTT